VNEGKDNSEPAAQVAGAGPAGDREQDFLQQCLRAHCDPRRRDALLGKAAHAGLDWSRVLEQARAARIGPIVHHVLAGATVAPDAFLAALSADYRQHSSRNLLLLRELDAVLERFDANGIKAVVLKGAALAESLYGKIGLRPMHDVDLLARRSDLRAVQKSLASLGWQPAPEWAGRGAAVREAQAEAAGVGSNEMLFYKDAPLRLPLEIHWRLFDPQHFQHRVDMEWFWRNTRSAKVGSRRALVLGDEAELLHLCGHLHLHHGGDKPLWLHDIALLVRRKGETIDWQEVAARAREFDLVVSLAQTLRRVVADWRIELRGAARAIEGLRPSSAELKALERLARPPASELERVRGDLSGMSARQRVRFLRSSLFPSLEYMRERYRIRHPALLPLYYPYRWLRGAATAMRGRR
jgi:hypothetical protein